MKIRLFPVFFFLVFTASAQDYKLKVGLKIVPENTVRFGDGYVGTDVRNYRFNYVTMGAGIQTVLSLTKLIEFETGLYYHRQKYGWSETLYFDGVFVPSDVVQSFTFLQVPVVVRFNFENFYAGAGTTLNYQFTTDVKSSTGYPFPDDSDHKLGVGLIVTFGKDWKVTDELSVITEVRANGIPGRGAGMNAGLGLGVNYKIRN